MLEKMFILPVLCVGYAISTDCLVFPFGLYFFFFLVSDCRVVVRFYMDVGWMSEIKIDSLIHWLIEQTQPQLQISDIIIIQTTVVSRPTITPHAGLCLPIALVNGPTTAESRVYTGPHSLHAVVYVAYASEFTPPMPQSLRRLRLRVYAAYASELTQPALQVVDDVLQRTDLLPWRPLRLTPPSLQLRQLGVQLRQRPLVVTAQSRLHLTRHEHRQ